MRVSKYKYLLLLLFLTCCLLLFSYIYRIGKKQLVIPSKQITSGEHNSMKRELTSDPIIISFVVCDLRLNESLNIVKSVLLFTTTPVYFVIFTDDNLMPNFRNTLDKWKNMRLNLDYELHKIKFPESYEDEWMNLFSKCAAQRLFIPKLLPHIDSIIYVDTDTLFLGPADELWQFFYQFNSSQISAMALEDENPNVSWYPRFAKHPFYGKYGLNSGVMLMNLTRMRSFGWVDYVTPIMLKYKLYIPWGDQDIINIIFHYHERAVLVLPCRYNYRTDQCMYGDACPTASARGVHVLHGSRKAFHSHKQPAFEAIYRAVDEYEFTMDPRTTVLLNLPKYLDDAKPSACGSLKEFFIRMPNSTIYSMYNRPNR